MSSKIKDPDPPRTSLLEQHAAAAQAELRAAEAEVEALRRRHEETLALLAEAERRRAAAEYWLAEHRASVSWRVTEPLRRIKRLAGMRARRSR
jgi:hypothetical protein